MLDAEQHNGERRVPDLPDGIPELDALSNDMQRRFCLAVFECETYVEAYARAGYVNGSAEAARNCASRLAQLPKVRLAINALAKINYGSLGPTVVKQIVQILKDSAHPEHGKMLRHVATALWPVETRSHQQIDIHHDVRVATEQAEMEELVTRFAAQYGIPVERLLGVSRGARRQPKQIEHAPVVDETTPDSRPSCKGE
jgi:phage terminase small subunit